MQRPTEKAVQKQILELLDLRGIFAWPVDAGAKMIRGRATGALKRAGLDDAARFVNFGQAGGARKGVVDIHGILDGGRALCIEVKQPEWLTVNGSSSDLIQLRGAGKPTDDQLKFLLAAHAAGAVCGVAWSTEDVEAILNEAAIGRPAVTHGVVFSDRRPSV